MTDRFYFNSINKIISVNLIFFFYFDLKFIKTKQLMAVLEFVSLLSLSLLEYIFLSNENSQFLKYWNLPLTVWHSWFKKKNQMKEINFFCYIIFFNLTILNAINSSEVLSEALYFYIDIRILKKFMVKIIFGKLWTFFIL